MNLKGTVSTRRQIEIKSSSIASFRTLKSLQTLRVLSQTTEAEILKTYDSTVGDAHEIHRVVPNVVIILHPLVAVRAARHKASDTGTIIIIRWKSEDLETLRSHLGTRIGIAIGGSSCPLVVGSIRVIASNLHHTTFGDGLLVPRNLHGSHHRLTGEAESTRRTMIENIPLTVDLLQRAVCIVACVGGDQLRAVFTKHHTTGVYQHATRAPRA